MSVKIRLARPAVIVVKGGPELRDWRESLKAPVPGAKYSGKHVSNGGWWDGTIQPGEAQYLGGNTWEMKFGRGLLDEIRDAFPDAPVSLDYDPAVVPWPDSLDHFDLPFTLYDYQRESLDELFERRWGRIALATNAGKGAIIGLAAASAARAGLPAVILSDEIAVFNALKEEIEKWAGVSPNLVEAGRDDPPPAEGVTLAMVPTLHGRIKEPDSGTPHHRRGDWIDWLEAQGMALLDEADRATADRWHEILGHLENTDYRAGFSGSFDAAAEESELDELKMLERIGPVLTEVKNEDLVEREISAKPVVHLHRYMQDLPKPRPGRWFDKSGPARRRWAYEEGVVYNEDRHALVQKLIEPDVPNCVIVERIDHGLDLAEYLDEAEFLYGEHSKEERDRTLTRFRDGEFRTLIATRIFDRGTNRLGAVVNLIFASGEGSKVQTLQRVGRGLRKEKDFLYLHDIIDTPPPGHTSKIDPYQYFVNSGRKRIQLYNTENFEIKMIDHARP